MTPRIGLIICSQRNPRVGPQIGEFIRQTIQETNPTTEIKLIDLAVWNLPLCDEPWIPTHIQSADQYVHPHTQAWSREISSHDGFIFITPQYNWGYPASIKNALDYLYHEWKGKPALIVSYGGRGGGKAAAQLGQVLQGLRMTQLERMVSLAFPEEEILLRGAKGEDLDLTGESSFWGGEKQGIKEAFVELQELVLRK
ncbi:hypothetical protein EYZ11_007956 [Aspergillus tanneri]|uniref:NADPH-dependent FMN reductase-like domain-containing protein n=1 Tax=Aspergillus tanneri TaxID=1220188 RepID=A0A4S3JDW1_9EURO|nr:uncharacterized protein ATNIH1004_005183 [Aspergillus tanneri]KAA8649282.1 hypothetical protein ATNIH1004_005183 [Aspergillus tanneri]THC92568.1 hypothetical protein EYZ11_007956 [Aspergillus tanneri]